MAGGKGAHGRSSIYRDDAGWQGWVSLGTDPLTGRRRRRHVRGATRQEVVKKVQKIEAKREEGDLDVHGSDLTLELWLRHWLSGVHRTRTSQTYNRYEWAVRLYLIPVLGEQRLDQLTSTLIERALSGLARSRKIGPFPASDSTRRGVLNVLTTALNQAVKQNRLRRNPCTGVCVATVEPAEIDPLDQGEIAAVVAAVRTRRNGARWLVGLTLGLRQSEALGLHWSDIDLDNQILNVRTQLARLSWAHGCPDPGFCGPAGKCPQRTRRQRQIGLKTRASRRVWHLDEPLVQVLKAHRRTQTEERLRAGSMWIDNNLVFATQTGTPLEQRNDLRDWQAVLKEAGLSPARIHDLRHTSATMMLVGGVPTRVVMELMGWTTQSMTNRYQHVVPELSQLAARSISAIVFAQPQPRSEPDNAVADPPRTTDKTVS